MTSTVTDAVYNLIMNSSFDQMTGTFGVGILVLLLALLVLREVARGAGTPRAHQWVETLNIALLPLLVAFAIIVLVRLENIVY